MKRYICLILQMNGNSKVIILFTILIVFLHSHQSKIMLVFILFSRKRWVSKSLACILESTAYRYFLLLKLMNTLHRFCESASLLAHLSVGVAQVLLVQHYQGQGCGDPGGNSNVRKKLKKYKEIVSHRNFILKNLSKFGPFA